MKPNEGLLSPSIQLREFKFGYPSSLTFKKQKKKNPSFKLSTIFKDFVGNMKKKETFFSLLPNLFI